jgi:hypothetical protein
MTATAPPPLSNRIAGYLPPTPLPVPPTPEAKGEAWGNAIFAAVLFYQGRLADPDPDVAERAARALFEMERTRLRHNRDLAGSTVPPQPADDGLPPVADLPSLSSPARAVTECEAVLAAVLAADELDDAPEAMESDPAMADEEAVEVLARGPDFPQ